MWSLVKPWDNIDKYFKSLNWKYLTAVSVLSRVCQSISVKPSAEETCNCASKFEFQEIYGILDITSL